MHNILIKYCIKKFIKKEHFMKLPIRQFHKVLFIPVYYGTIVVFKLNV